MSPDLENAFCGVYHSSREIVHNDQRHLFCSMLDLLTNTCKATGGVLINSISKDDQISFWCNDILPLVFDDDIAIQMNAIKALEQGTLKLDTEIVHSSKHWSSIRNTIITEHLARLHKMRDQKTHQWHHVWCLLVHLLDRDILRNASTINSFLAIVELGFRSPDNEIRIEAFSCWRLLIKLFTAHNEIFNKKRLKLISIPLKSSQAKTVDAAVVKFRVWWYLLTCLGSRVVEFFEPVMECFLVFCFGGRGRSSQGAALLYEDVRELALPCWATLLTANGEPMVNDLLERTLRGLDLEPFEEASPLVDFASLDSRKQLIVDATLQAIRLLFHTDSSSSESAASDTTQYTLERLMRYLMKPMLCLDEPTFAIQICRELMQFLPMHPRPVEFAINCIATEGLQWYQHNSNGNVDDYADVMESLMQLLAAGKSVAVPRAILQRCVEQVFSLKAFGSGRSQWRALAIVLDLITESMLITGDNDLYELRLMVWQHVTATLLDYLADNSLDCRLKDYAAVLNRWTIWPLGYYAQHARAITSSTFDVAFCTLWRRLLSAGQNTPDRQEFLNEVNQKLQLLLPLSSDDAYFGELLNAYAAEVLKLEHVKDLTHFRQLFALIKNVIVADAPPKSLEAYLIVVRMIVTSLQDSQLLALIDTVKTCITHVHGCVEKQSLGKSFYTEWKQAIQQRIRAHANKCISSTATELFKNSDVFVVIPSVWSLNPDKLTDHQKERFRKKTDIPALYNDMSHSQESASIKPWTPNKIIVPKEDHTHAQVVNQKNSGDNVDDMRSPQPMATASNISTPTVTAATPTSTASHAVKSNTSERKRPVRQSMRSQRKLITESAMPTPLVDNPAKENQPINIEPSPIVEANNNKANEQQVTETHLNSEATDNNDTFCTATFIVSHDEANHNHNNKNKNAMRVEEKEAEKEEEDMVMIDSDPVEIKSNANDGNKTDELKNAEANVRVHDQIEIASVHKQQHDAAEATAQCEVTKGNGGSQSPTELLREPTAKVDKESSALLNGNLDLMDQKIMSPKRITAKYTPLTSPPDRKLTNNSTSPTLRPKPLSHLTGRGAQLINMIRNKKIDLTPSTHASHNGSAQSLTKSCHSANFTKSEKPIEIDNGGGVGGGAAIGCGDVASGGGGGASGAIEPAIDAAMEPEHTSTPMQCRDLLVFSRTLPSMRASPTTSILKRKVRSDSLDEACIDSPLTKRKRVSFHDPPVSLTKEYIRDVDENKPKLKRCLNMDRVGGMETKHALKRQHKQFSIAQIENYITLDRPEKMDSGVMQNALPSLNNSFNADNPPLAKGYWSDGNCKQMETELHVPTAAPTTAPTTNDLSSFDAETLLNFVVQNHGIETLLDKYFVAENTSTPKMPNALAKYLSGYMTSNPNAKTSVLEVLSENHSKDFLDHAIQENLSSVVCDRLNLNSVIDYICAKSKINANCRSNLLTQLPEIFKQCKGQKERTDCIQQLLKTTDLSDSEILEFITLLMEKRSMAKNCTTVDVSASESAVDSSSNL